MAPSDTLRNVLRNALRLSYFGVMAHKVAVRVLERARRDEGPASRAWCTEHAESLDAFATACDPELWREALAFADEFEQQARDRLDRLDAKLAGASCHPLLYFLVRHLRPTSVLETGVAAGYSSQAILRAMAENGGGTLYSSDFPYFRLENPEQYVGCLVDEELRPGWSLHLEGDRKNLEVILARARPFDLVHYDSDKSYAGRRFVIDRIRPRHLSDGCVVVMDDIEDNLYFRDWVEAEDCRFRVFAYRGKYIGVVGL